MGSNFEFRIAKCGTGMPAAVATATRTGKLRTAAYVEITASQAGQKSEVSDQRSEGRGQRGAARLRGYQLSVNGYRGSQPETSVFSRSSLALSVSLAGCFPRSRRTKDQWKLVVSESRIHPQYADAKRFDH
jgi:hypothetical protein